MIRVPDMGDDEIETVYLARLKGVVALNDVHRRPDIRKVIGEYTDELWLRIMTTTCPRWRAERLARIARRMYRESTWYLKPWQVIIDLSIAGLIKGLKSFEPRNRGRSCRCG